MWLGVGAGAGLLASWHLGRQAGRQEVAREVAVLVQRVEDASEAIFREREVGAPAPAAVPLPPRPPPPPPRGGVAARPGGVAPVGLAGAEVGRGAVTDSPRSPMREALRQTSKAMKRAVGIPSKAELARRRSGGLPP